MGGAHLPPRRELRWWGWGEDAAAPALPAQLAELARAALGISRALPRVASSQVRLAPSLLPERPARELADRLGPQWLLRDEESRLRHACGRSTSDLLRLRAGELAGAPDAVAMPADHRQVREVLALCARERIAVVPFGGGTSVVGGLTVHQAAGTGAAGTGGAGMGGAGMGGAERRDGGHSAVLALDLRRLNRLLELDEVSRTATLEPGLQGPQAEALLAAHGYTLGHHPQSYQYATLGGFAATRSAGQASSGYGRFDERVLGLRLATAHGTLEVGRAPRSAAGPDLRQLILGSEGALGVITALRLQLDPSPAQSIYEGFRLPSFEAGVEALRQLAQDTAPPTLLRLSDESESALELLMRGAGGAGAPSPGGALAIVGLQGEACEVARRRERCAALLGRHGAQAVPGAGDSWARERYSAPCLRDALLDAGALVETLETACYWSSLHTVHRQVGDALREALCEQGTPPLVLCHVSHTYPAGASLYFTVAAAAAEDPLAQWAHAKRAAGEAILASGATITHHHGVGRDHRELYERELGELGLALMRALKRTLDPEGILNPGALVLA